MVCYCVKGGYELHKIEKVRKIIKEYGFLQGSIVCLSKGVARIIKYYYAHNHNPDVNQVMFYSKPAFSDNCRAMYQYLRSTNTNYHYVWLYDEALNMDSQESTDTTFIPLISPAGTISAKALRAISKSKIVFFSHSSPFKYLEKHNDQFVVNLWHGCGFKKVEPRDKKWIDTNPFDYALVPGDLFIETKEQFWGCSKESILPIGYPRYDYLLRTSSEAEAFVNRLLGENRHFVIWMPTFRQTANNNYPEGILVNPYGLPLLTHEQDLVDLNELCKKLGIVLCVKRHQFQLSYSCETRSLSNVIFLDNETLRDSNIELYSLLHYTSALITDYSSVSVDYLLLEKPMAFTLDDYKEYNLARGFVFEDPVKYMPGHHLYVLDDLKQFLYDIASGNDQYGNQRKEMTTIMHNRTNNYCERIWTMLNELFENQRISF